ncbi:UvrD-helicase domain-containing protein [Antrihabitans sp. YC2-6]|uniref:UvrD-helicase domain-containing protein n=1 Tax=Antrihabitans sp. YC2-6 TaxID=2799498 RepID=UPI0018F759A0|nr:UvrD-helicase domain-containing protein [Antrihabitans sp. YC2-6]MBJ8346504.1 UvrD-helicase domain-containing protein [Antrihabitans sp. YC2-6]
MSFDLYGPLPTGTTVLEASAGTGKTYAIVGLATRYVAEGVVRLSELLLVTFSRAATQELRERTRERLTFTATALADPDSARTHTDDLVRLLAQGDDAAIAIVRQRLLRELSEFDAATIATTHSFCQRMLDALGIAGEREPNVSLVESVDDLVAEVVEDLYLRVYSSERPRMRLEDARRVALAAITDRHANLAPDAGQDSEAAQRAAFAAAVRQEVERRKRIGGIRDFDDLLVLLRDTLADPEHGDAACRRIRDRYRVVLVDEFQDTDPIQWEILRRAFHGSTTLVLVGDPKQAIYAFRGAEVSSYLSAVRLADSRQELTKNFRSDAGLLTALDHLYGGAALGHPEIVVHQVDPSDPAKSRLASGKPLRVRYLPRTGSGPTGKSGFASAADLRRRVAADLAADVVARLDGSVEPGDIAVLARRWAHIPFIRDALDAVGVPSVLAGGTSVFATDTATHWLWLMQALAAPHRQDRIRLAALTPLLGFTAAELDARGDDIVAEVSGQLREWAALFALSGFAALFERLSAQTNLDGRLLGVVAGERVLTDVRHIAQLLNRVAVEQSLGLIALTRWLTDRIEDPKSGGSLDRVRRLDSDAAAMQIATVHASKGLEFPVVYVPYGWDGAKNPNPSTLLLHGAAGERILDVGGQTGPGYRERQQRSDIEEAGEELRLLYVAVTRAMSQVVLWWVPGFSTGISPLHRFVMGRVADSPEVELRATVPDDVTAAARLAAWGDAAADVISVEPVPPGASDTTRWSPGGSSETALAAAMFTRELDMGWRRTSYSALTATVHETGHVGSEAEEPGTTDEPDEVALDETVVDGPPSPMNGFPPGPAFGTLVHEVLEVVDTSVPNLSNELLTKSRQAIAASLAAIEPADLAAALELVMQTPLGYGTLAEVRPGDRLAELDFELPLAGGDNPTVEHVTLVRIADLLRRYLPADDVLAPYAGMLATVDAAPLRGYLSGSIDLVVRTPDQRFVVADYKTNRIVHGELSVLHFDRAAMAGEMLRSHYPLQALLYSVALHRYLRWRLTDYDPHRHLGGVQYLFVRGMIGPDTPPGCGVFDWEPPADLIVALSDLLAGVR